MAAVRRFISHFAATFARGLALVQTRWLVTSVVGPRDGCLSWSSERLSPKPVIALDQRAKSRRRSAVRDIS
jgi:hypothetical protein